MKFVKVTMAVMVAVCMLAFAGFAGEKGEGKNVKLNVTGMMCDSCQSKVKSSLEKVEGVKSADVDWNKGTALVTLAKADVKNEELVKAVKSAGSKFDAKVADKEKKEAHH